MSAYVIAEIEVVDPEPYKAYTSRVQATLEPFGGRFLVRGGKTETMEGEWTPSRVVVTAFPSVEHARSWLASPAYQAIAAIRHRHAKTRFLTIVEGYDPPPGDA